MINAKDRFRQGYIMLTRPFEFAEMDKCIQQHTIVWAYAEKPIERQVLNKMGKEKVENVHAEHSGIGAGLFSKDYNERMVEDKIELLMKDPKYFDTEYKGEIVQATIDGQLCRFYPDEYTILSKEKLTTYLSEEAYHADISKALNKNKSFVEQRDYLMTRAVPKRTAEKWASIGFGDSVIYRPYFSLLLHLVRQQHIYECPYYVEKEGLSIQRQKELIKIA